MALSIGILRAGGVAKVMMHLPSKLEALSSNPSTSKNKNQHRA
jgi:hypothetical protein